MASLIVSRLVWTLRLIGSVSHEYQDVLVDVLEVEVGRVGVAAKDRPLLAVGAPLAAGAVSGQVIANTYRAKGLDVTVEEA